MTLQDIKQIIIKRVVSGNREWGEGMIHTVDASKFRHDYQMETVVFEDGNGDQFVVSIEKIGVPMSKGA